MLASCCCSYYIWRAPCDDEIAENWNCWISTTYTLFPFKSICILIGHIRKVWYLYKKAAKNSNHKNYFFWMFIGKYSNFQSSEIKGCKSCTICQFSNSSNYLAYLLQMQFIIDYGGTILSIKKWLLESLFFIKVPTSCI